MNMLVIEEEEEGGKTPPAERSVWLYFRLSGTSTFENETVLDTSEFCLSKYLHLVPFLRLAKNVYLMRVLRFEKILSNEINSRFL